MADLESLSFALLIPFCICFVLVFLVCCFADEVKTICRFPSQIPTNYITVTPQRSHRDISRGRLRATSTHLDMDETRILIRNQEERSRTSSESSSESGPSYLTVIPEYGPLVLQQGQIICPQTVLENGRVIQHPSQIIPHTMILTPSSNTVSHGNVHCISSTPLVNSNICDKVPSIRTVCTLPSITERVELTNEKTKLNFANEIDNSSTEEHRRPIRNLPQVISPNLLSEKKQ